VRFFDVLKKYELVIEMVGLVVFGFVFFAFVWMGIEHVNDPCNRIAYVCQSDIQCAKDMVEVCKIVDEK
jgi:hypothetical protein